MLLELSVDSKVDDIGHTLMNLEKEILKAKFLVMEGETIVVWKRYWVERRDRNGAPRRIKTVPVSSLYPHEHPLGECLTGFADIR